MKYIRASNRVILATVNTPKNFTISLGANLDSGSKMYMVESTLDLDETDLDADGAGSFAILKKGDISNTGSSIADASTVGGSRVNARREAANIFRHNAPKTYQPKGAYVEIPIVDGTGKMTISLGQTGASALLAACDYEIIAVVDK